MKYWVNWMFYPVLNLGSSLPCMAQLGLKHSAIKLQTHAGSKGRISQLVFNMKIYSKQLMAVQPWDPQMFMTEIYIHSKLYFR